MVGGPHPTVRSEDIPGFVDYIVQGEGEKAILEIINGSNERVIHKKFATDLDTLPPPAWEYFAGLPYDFACDFFPERPAFNLNTSRGCPFNCTFCSNASIWGKMNRRFSAERIVEDVRVLMSDYGARGIYFREDNFVCNKNRVSHFCELLLKKNINLSWACETRVDNPKARGTSNKQQTNNEPTSNEQRATSNEQRATSNEHRPVQLGRSCPRSGRSPDVGRRT